MWISIDPDSGIALNRQLYNKLKEMILDGSLVSGKKLPSTRALSKELSISRNTVLEVYSRLISEGYIEGHHGSGTVVSDNVPKQLVRLDKREINSIPDRISSEEGMIDFRSGVPDLEYFPRRIWGRLYHNICCDLPASAFRYNNPAGVYELRNAISDYLYRMRGITCNPHNIMITSGSTQGLSFISKLLFKEVREVLAEDPIHKGLVKVIQSIGYSITGVPADGKGMNTDLLKPNNNVSFIYTTPSHQYPLGGILPLPRRNQLIQYSLDNHCYILEDDYDSEFRFEGQPVNSLYELNPERVIYIGSFSKILAPALRLGFILLPDELIAPYKELKQYTDVHTEAISQYVLAEFIQNGDLERHIRRMKRLYAKKREHLLKEMKAYFTQEYEIMGQAAGLHIVVHFRKILFTPELMGRIAYEHIKIYPVANYSLNHRVHLNEIILGYAHLTFTEITEGIRKLSKILN